MSKQWKLMKLAFRYYSLGFQRIIFMILGAQIAFLLCYAFFVQLFHEAMQTLVGAGHTLNAIPLGSETVAGAMVMAGVTAIVYTIWTLLLLAAVALIVGYIRNYLAVLSYYDEEKYAGYKKYRAPQTMAWLMNFSLGKEAEQNRLAAIEDCKRRCKEIKEEIE